MIGNPEDPAAITDFDADSPVEFIWHERVVQVYRVAAFEGNGAPQPPRLMMRVDGRLLPPLGPCQHADTRQSIQRKAELALERVGLDWL
jgi:hypothetical protein